jgi:Asp/Glu/hydantoin racemase
MDRKKIVVINPNSLQKVTQAFDGAVAPFRRLPVDIVCLTSPDGPAGIQTQQEADAAIAPMYAVADLHAEDAAAFVVACFSDPGLHGLRERVRVPVLGIAECAMFTAMGLGARVGVVAIAKASIPRHYRYFGAMGITDRIAGERSLDLQVAQLADENSAFIRMRDVATRLRDEDGADVLVMGCAGMANMKARLEEASGLPVVEPVQAAVGMAIGRIFAS